MTTNEFDLDEIIEGVTEIFDDEIAEIMADSAYDLDDASLVRNVKYLVISYLEVLRNEKGL